MSLLRDGGLRGLADVSCLQASWARVVLSTRSKVRTVTAFVRTTDATDPQPRDPLKALAGSSARLLPVTRAGDTAECDSPYLFNMQLHALP